MKDFRPASKPFNKKSLDGKTELKIEDGVIKLDSERGRIFGFTSDKFTEVSYLWKNGKYIYISFIESQIQNKGFFRELCQQIQRLGYGIKVPTPFPKMELILREQKYRKTKEFFKEAKEWCEVWVKEPLEVVKQ